MSDIKKAELLPASSASDYKKVDRRSEVNKVPHMFDLVSEILDKNLEHNLTSYDLLLFLTLLEFNNSLKWKRTFRRSYRQLSERSGIPYNKIKKVIGRLVDAGLVQVEFGKGGDKTDIGNKTLFSLKISSYFEEKASTDQLTKKELIEDDQLTKRELILDGDQLTKRELIKNDGSVPRSVDEKGTISIYNTNNFSLSYIAKLQDFDFYYKDLHREKRKFLDDEIFIRDQENDFPDLDIKRTLEKACRDYYSRPSGHAKILRDCDRDQLPPDFHRIFAEAIADHRNWIKKEKTPTEKLPRVNGGLRKTIAIGELVSDPEEFKKQANKGWS